MAATCQLPGFQGLFLGHTVKHAVHEVQQGPSPYNRSSNWTFRPGTYTAREFMRHIAVLLESVIVQLGADEPGGPSTRSILMDGLRSSLSHEGREATLLLADWNSERPSAITKQALRVGSVLFNYAHEFNGKVRGDPHLTIYSPCEGHKWVPPAGRLLRSNRSSPILMMLYNEWLHQITCLRDGLLPFHNFEDVPLILGGSTARGTRPLEDIRRRFVTKIQLGHANQADFIEVAKVFTAPNLPSGGYGFQYCHGTVLPESLFSEGRSQLMRYLPTTLVDVGKRPVLFDYGSDLLVSADTVDVTSDMSLHQSPSRLLEAAITAEGNRRDSFEDAEVATLPLKLVGVLENGKSFSVGIGRILERLACLRCIDLSERPSLNAGEKSEVFEASELLPIKGTLTHQNAAPLIIRATDPVIWLAVVGKLETDEILMEMTVNDRAAKSRSKGAPKGSPQIVIVKN